jgi:Flp pilus assembly secretin CpaC
MREAPRAYVYIVALALAALADAAPGLAGAVSVHIDQNTVVNLAAPAGDIVVGNASIADVSLINPHRLAILGRSYGLTNVVVTDRMGRTIFQQEINVQPAPMGRISLYRGAVVSNYACSPRCERTPMPGEYKDKIYEAYQYGYKDYDDRSHADVPAQGGGQ